MSGTISGSLTPFGGLVPVNIDELFSLILDPAAYNASGSTMSTTGTINLSGTTPVMTLTGGLDFQVGQGVYISMNTSTPPFLTSIATVISPETLVLSGTAPTTYVGANSTIFHDDAAALNAAIRSGHITISGESGAFYQINGGGRPFNVSGPLTQQSGLVLEDFKLIPLASSLWVSGTLASGHTTIGPVSNGVIYNPPGDSAYSVVCRDILIDINTLLVNGIANYGEATVLYENCKVNHWGGGPTQTTAGIGLYNPGKCLAINCQFIQWESANIESQNPTEFNSGYALYCDNITGAAGGDSLFQGCNFSCGLRPVYIADNFNNVRFSGCHTWPFWGSSTTLALPDATNFEIHGSNITIEDHYLDSGCILIVQDTATNGLDIKIDIGACIYNKNFGSYSSHVLVSTSAIHAVPGNIFISPDSLFAGTLAGTLSLPVPILQFETSAGGSWDVFSTSIQSEVLAAQHLNLLTTNGGLLVAELGATTSVVATLMGNSATATSLNFIDGATSIYPPPQVGSEGNDIVLSYNGTVAFRGSALNGCAIIGNSPSTLAVTTNAVYSQNASTWLGFIDSGTSAAVAPQVGSEGDDIVLRYDGTVIFRGSALSGHAIIGNSPSTLTVTSDAVYSNNASTWLGFIDSGTTAAVSPQVGSEGDDIVLRYDGTVIFRGSAINGHAIIGNSPSTLSVTSDTVYTGNTATWLGFIDSGTTAAVAPQVGSEGDDIVLRYDGTVIFRESAINGHAIIGNSPSTLSVTSDTVYTGNTATWLGFIDSGTTAAVAPQVGSEGDDIVLRYDGTVIFRGSALNNCAVIGNSTGTQTFVTHTALTGNGDNPAFQLLHSATTHPQGLTVNFTDGAPNNKIDHAFGFQDTVSSSFKTAIWSDGSVAHPAFGFNVSEIQSLAVPNLMGTPTPYQIAKGSGTGSILAGTYELFWNSGGYRQQHMIVAVGYAPSDGSALITVLHNWLRGGNDTISDPTVAYDSSNIPYLLANLSPTVAGTLTVQGRGCDTDIALLETPSGTTILTSGVLLNTVNQTDGGLILVAISETASSSNAVTNKIKVDIGGTVYYLLASTSPT